MDVNERAEGHGRAKVPPRWFIRTAWVVHRGLYRVTGGRLGLRRPTADVYGMLRLHTIGRKSGRERIAIVAYFEDGSNLVTMAMNGWADAAPAWWLNLRAQPLATVDLPGRMRRHVCAREADGTERERLWAVFRTLENDGSDLDTLASSRSQPTPVVVLEPADTTR